MEKRLIQRWYGFTLSLRWCAASCWDSRVRIHMGWFHDCESAPTMWVISHWRGRLTHVQTRRKHLVSGASTAPQGTHLTVNTQLNTTPLGTALIVNSVNIHIRLQCQGSSYLALQHTQANAISTLKVIQNTFSNSRASVKKSCDHWSLDKWSALESKEKSLKSDWKLWQCVEQRGHDWGWLLLKTEAKTCEVSGREI